MPNAVRLPAHVPDGELRVWWGRSDEGTGLMCFAPRRLQRYLLSILDGERLAYRPDASLADMMRANERLLERGRSPLDELEAAGYDPATVVLSIRRKGEPAPQVDVAADVRSRLEEVQASLERLSEAVAAIEEAKGLYVMDDGERDAVVSASGEASEAVARALDTLALSARVEPEPAVPAPDGTNLSRHRAEFDKVVILSWEDADGEDGDGTHLFLKDKDRTVGEVYETESGWRWRCRPTDWRSTEETEREARDCLVADYCQWYANEAREALRQGLKASREGGAQNA